VGRQRTRDLGRPLAAVSLRSSWCGTVIGWRARVLSCGVMVIVIAAFSLGLTSSGRLGPVGFSKYSQEVNCPSTVEGLYLRLY